MSRNVLSVKPGLTPFFENMKKITEFNTISLLFFSFLVVLKEISRKRDF